MNVVFIVPTGVGAEIGGHAGDATPAAKLIASLCDNFITHPNVVNASDINEMPENTLYVEGSMLDRFLLGEFFLKKVTQNRVLVVTNSPLKVEVINSVNAARVTIGMSISIVVLKTRLRMNGYIINGKVSGEVFGYNELLRQVKSYDFDALAITTPIDVDRETKFNYFKNGGINPWGKVEAMASKLIASALDKPVAHSPVDNTIAEDDPELYFFNMVVDPRMSAEMVSVSYLHCILKGLHKAPRISKSGIGVEDISALITPIDCVGTPHLACMKAGIPIIAVKENKTILNDKMPDSFIVVENYLEAAGVLSAMKTGVTLNSLKRPLKSVSIK